MKQEQPTAILTQSVTRALSILSCFTDEQPELRVIDFAKKLELTQSNVSRLLTTMVTLGYVEKDEFTGFYRLGTEIISLGGTALNHYEIRKQALPELHELERELGLGANLAILNGNQMFYLAHVDSHKAPRMYTLIGRRNPLHCTGIGKVLLANMDPNKATELIYTESFLSFTDKTITDPALLEEHLEQVRKKGYATEIEELALGRACIAAPVRGRSGKVLGGISLSGPLSEIRLPSREQELASILIEATDRISMKMGYITANFNLY
ncbi:IclR family transcriptional regulator [Paenibacillus agricola]|uniref:IclR family transcriptional regulator n=1 Tax=Paenibacillus agricola TaxID=2716264 RepID=A0ABX0J9G8_9BACL|nr:IclR family transcriptional regulator [Paenibacillus agricola]NHN31849.1 IclR family transcriptional regulator [Paenibacillus agricola]